jgi:hypothetical protein
MLTGANWATLSCHAGRETVCPAGDYYFSTLISLWGYGKPQVGKVFLVSRHARPVDRA